MLKFIFPRFSYDYQLHFIFNMLFEYNSMKEISKISILKSFVFFSSLLKVQILLF